MGIGAIGGGGGGGSKTINQTVVHKGFSGNGYLK
jgi:hypothetical protein